MTALYAHISGTKKATELQFGMEVPNFPHHVLKKFGPDPPGQTGEIPVFPNRRIFSPKNRAENGPDDPEKPGGAGPRPLKDTDGTRGDSHAKFQLHRPKGLGGDSEQRSKIGPDFDQNFTKTSITWPKMVQSTPNFL